MTILAKRAREDSNTLWAQGGIAAVMDPDDTPAAHVEDTLVAGAGLLCEVGLGRAALEARYPDTPFLWLDSEDSVAEVFWLPRADFPKG